MTNHSETLGYSVRDALRKMCKACDEKGGYHICPSRKMDCWAYEEMAYKLVETMNKEVEEFEKNIVGEK